MGGMSGGIAIANYFWPILMPIALSILWSGFYKNKSNFIWGFSFVLASHFWLVYLHPLTWLGFSSLFSLLVTFIILFSCSFCGGVLVFTWGWLGQKILTKNYIYSLNTLSLVKKIIFLSFIWAFGELILTQTPFFWIGISESLIPGDLYLAGLARFIGSPGLCIIQLLIGFWIFIIFERYRKNLRYIRIFEIGFLIITFLHIFGAISTSSENSSFEYPIGVSQTNIPTREKTLINNQKIGVYILDEQVRALSNNAKLLILPEGTLNTSFQFEQPSKLDSLVGGFRKEEGNLKSSLLAFKKGDKKFSNFIDKYRVVPLGEKIPKFLNKISKGGLSAVGGIEAGEKQSRFFKLETHPPFAIAICYEISDGIKIRHAVKSGSEIIISIANLDPYPNQIFHQFLSLARMRSIENNKDTLIASNTGPSALVRSNGKIHSILKFNQKGYGTFFPKIYKKSSFYTKFGLMPLIIIFILLTLENIKTS